jgi:hypothetical protein
VRGPDIFPDGVVEYHAAAVALHVPMHSNVAQVVRHDHNDLDDLDVKFAASIDCAACRVAHVVVVCVPAEESGASILRTVGDVAEAVVAAHGTLLAGGAPAQGMSFTDFEGLRQAQEEPDDPPV